MILKRCFDVILAIILLLALSPVILGLSVVLRVCQGSPVIYRQLRPGLRGAPFMMVKFRSMERGVESDELRLTEIGRKIRSSSLDELPEFWNILKGDMSFVGPRPLLMDYLPLYTERQARRHEVRPGLTGLAQVSGRNLLGWSERFELDVQYVETRSFSGDLIILARTVAAVLTGNGVMASDGSTMNVFDGSQSQKETE